MQETSLFVGIILVFMSSWNFVLSWVEYEKSLKPRGQILQNSIWLLYTALRYATLNVKVKTLTPTRPEAVHVAHKISGPGHISLKKLISAHQQNTQQNHTGKCIRGFDGIYAYFRYFRDRKWKILV